MRKVLTASVVHVVFALAIFAQLPEPGSGSGGGGGSGSGNVTASGTLTDTACATGAGASAIKTPSANCTVDVDGNLGAKSISTGSAPPACAALAGTSGLNCLKGGTAPTGLAGTAELYANSDGSKVLGKLNNGAADEVCFQTLANCGGASSNSGFSEFSALSPTGVSDIMGGAVTKGIGYSYIQKTTGTLLSFTVRSGTVTGGTAWSIALYNAACTTRLGYARSTTMTSSANTTVSMVSSLALTAGTKYNIAFFTDATAFDIISLQNVQGWAFSSSPNAFKTGNDYDSSAGTVTPPSACGTNTTISFLPAVAPIFNY